MAVNITDLDVLTKMTKLEGEDWCTYQYQHERDEYSFFFAARYWFDFSDGGKDWFDSNKTILYGAGGFHRYYINEDGTVRFSHRHALPDAIAKALSLGFA